MSQLIDWLAMLIERGGPVMYPLFGVSVLSLALIFERSVFWVRLNRAARGARLTHLNVALRSGDRAKAAKLSEDHHTPFDHVARWLLKSGATDSVAIDAFQRERPRLDRFMVTLSTIISAAPLLGILGTVTGIIQSFNLLGEQSALTDPRDVSAGIAEALITTAFGLIIALFTLFPYMIFRAQVDRSIGRLESLIAAAEEGEKRRAAPTENGADGATISQQIESRGEVAAARSGKGSA